MLLRRCYVLKRFYLHIVNWFLLLASQSQRVFEALSCQCCMSCNCTHRISGRARCWACRTHRIEMLLQRILAALLCLSALPESGGVGCKRQLLHCSSRKHRLAACSGDTLDTYRARALQRANLPPHTVLLSHGAPISSLSQLGEGEVISCRLDVRPVTTAPRQQKLDAALTHLSQPELHQVPWGREQAFGFAV